MANPVYDITPADLNSVNWLSCRLVMEMNEQYFLFVVLSEDSELVALKYYPFSINETYPLREQLYEIVKGDEVLHKNMKEFFVVYNVAENSFIPESVFQYEFSNQVLEFVHGDLRKGMLLSEKLEEAQLYNVFRVQEEIHEFFTTGFPSARFFHYFSLWMKCLLAGSMQDKVTLVFYPKNLLVAVTVSGKPQLMQTLPYQTPEDVAFYLLNIFANHQFSQEETTVFVGGLVDVDSTVFEELLKYFQNVETIDMPTEVTLPGNAPSFPAHFFSPILKLALCAS